MTHTITLISGDGIGPEVTAATREILSAAGVAIRWDERLAGTAAVEAFGVPCPDELVASIQQHRIALKGPIDPPTGRGARSVDVTLRRSLDLFACVRPVRVLEGIPSRVSGLDLVLVRESTEGFLAGHEHMVVPGVAESIKVVSERASARIAEFAFRHARALGRREITVAHKASVLRMSDGLFLDCFRQAARRHPGLDTREVLVDACAAELVVSPERFDVLLTDSVYGELFSELCAGLVGGLGVVAGASYGEECAVFEVVHGSDPDRAGAGVANPTAMILGAVMMLRALGELDAASRIERAVRAVHARGSARTEDLGGNSSTAEFTRAVILAMERPRGVAP
jgi:isocitrate dehydrogenase (NAD+)